MNKGERIYQLALSAGLSEELARYITAQSAHETNGFTSPLTVSNNNYFGMKYAGQALASGELFGYAQYPSLENSVSDMCVWWIKARNQIFSFPLYVNSLEKFVTFLKNQKYFEADYDEYLTGVKYWYNKLYTV